MILCVDSTHTDAPGEAVLTLDSSVVYVETNVSVLCASDGRPSVDAYTWLYGGGMVHAGAAATWSFRVNSINMQGDYSCFGSNAPVGGRLNGTLSPAEHLTVQGNTGG